MSSALLPLIVGFLGGNTSAEIIKSRLQYKQARSAVISNFIDEWVRLFESTRENGLSGWDATTMGTKGSYEELVIANNRIKDLRAALLKVHVVADRKTGNYATIAFESLRQHLLHDNPCGYSSLNTLIQHTMGELNLRSKVWKIVHKTRPINRDY